jgi:hypothetical protein
MKNTTLARKATTGLERNSGVSRSTARVSQQGDGAAFAFNGQMGDGVNHSEKTHRFAGNQVGLTMKENYGLKTIKGNASDCHADRMERIGPSATKDSEHMTIATASQGHPIESGYNKVPHVANPDKIYITRAAR